jgi:spore germination cell wall hydrolase CwlJ-like protein
LRIYILSLVFAFGFIGNIVGPSTQSLAALGNPGNCFLPPPGDSTVRLARADARLLQLEPQLPPLDSEARDYLIRTIVFEAGGETEIGKVAVAHVILNRARLGRWGGTVKEVVTRPWQFEPWMTRRSEMERLEPSDARYRDAARIADGVLLGEMPDPTAGATHFLNPVIVKYRRGGSLPAWARRDGLPIGRHTFYALDGHLPVHTEDEGYWPLAPGRPSC